MQDIESDGLFRQELKPQKCPNPYIKRGAQSEGVQEQSLTAPILIAEDNAICLYALTSILVQFKIEFDTAYNGE